MLKALLKINISSTFRALPGRGKKRSKLSAALYALLLVYVVVMFGQMLYDMFRSFVPMLHAFGLDWMYFLYVAAAAFSLMFVFSVFSVKNKLYEARDNELLLAMPIAPRAILGSRLAGLWLLDFVYELIVVIPAAMAWFSQVDATAAGIIGFALTFLLLPLPALACSALFGWLLALVSARLRKKALPETLLSIALLAGYFYLFIKLTGNVRELAASGDGLAGSIAGISPLYVIGSGAAGDIPNLLLSALMMILPFVMTYIILGGTFVRTATAKRSAAKLRYVEREHKAMTPKAALLRHEFRRLFSSSAYTMNAGLGAIFLLAAGAALLIFGDTVRDFAQFMERSSAYGTDIVAAVFVLVIGLMSGMSVPSCSAVSLEGKYIWIVQSMPVEPADVLRAKLRLSLWLYMPPAMLCSLAMLIPLAPSIVTAIASFLLTAAMTAFFGLAGLVVNLRHPKLDWTTETEAVKQSGAVLIFTLIALGTLIAAGVGGWLLIREGVSIPVILPAFLLIFTIADYLSYRWLCTRGTRIFAEL